MAHTLAPRSLATSFSINPITLLTSGLATWRQRRALSRLDASARADLGLSQHQVTIEANRPMWDLPTTLLR